ncbi:hypothetical protein jhhlp_000588 [Lomentospora prolificans]|uniref:C2H2-type domain-containing protein n=1 Tax=Lomentospora prolificans TaxID=41688 RepID=A0A2N3NIY5_9PEZI|nr:hypothetical protein jhhlp_000588 [Lomentospora prolificans]
MAPRHQTLPAPQTSSAREARQAFYCSLCSKGYSRMNDYEAHLSSYDHTHKQRLKDMKAMVKDPSAGARARKAEAKADGLISVKLSEEAASSSGGGFKKGGFKKSGFKAAFGSSAAPANSPMSTAASTTSPSFVPQSSSDTAERAATNESRSHGHPEETDSEDEDYERYNPRHPTD